MKVLTSLIWAVLAQGQVRKIFQLRKRKKSITSSKTNFKTFKNTIILWIHLEVRLAKKSLDNGAKIINDISGGDLDKEMFKTIGKYKVPYIMMHMKGIPKNMQDNPNYKDVTVDIIKDLSQKN